MKTINKNKNYDNMNKQIPDKKQTRVLNKISAIGGILALCLTGISSGANTEEEIKVGVLYPTTGGCASIGTPALMGHQVMIDKINANGGLIGKKVTFVHRDSQCNADVSVAAARDLITKDKVQFLIGGVSSSVGLAVSEVAKQEKVIYIAAIPKTTTMTDKDNFHKYVFRSAANTNTEGKSAAIIANRQGWDNICTILLDYSYGHSLGKSFGEHIAKVRPQAKIVAQEWVKTGAKDYTPYISKLMSAGCDGVFSNIHIGYFPTFAKQAAPFGFFDAMEFVSAGEVGSSNLADAMGEDMPTGIWVYAYGVFYFPNTPENNEYVDGLRKITGKEHPSSWALPGYMAMQWLEAGIKKAGSTDSEAVISALEGMTIMTPVGSQTMRASDHQANRGQVWGQMNKSNISGYTSKVMDPVEYIPADDIMD